MSVAYEARSFLHEGTYPPIGDDPDHAADQRFTDSDVADHLSHYAAQAAIMPDDRAGVMGDERDMLVEDHGAIHDAAQLDLDVAGFSSPLHVPLHLPIPEPVAEAHLSLGPGGDSPLEAHPARIRPIPRPERHVEKGPDGKYHCTLPGCDQRPTVFARRCEWNKHMDKHERPYRCPAEGCEKIQGFTYSGGLLRHEREVHGRYGGPKRTVKCPHPGCKRNTGKGFSRLENLNEHLRRVHTPVEPKSPPANSAPNHPNSTPGADDSSDDASAGAPSELAVLREEMERMREENAKLKLQVEQQSLLMAQMQAMQEAIQHGLAPTAHML